MAYPSRADVQAALETLQSVVFEDTTASVSTMWNALHGVLTGLKVANPSLYKGCGLFPQNTLDAVNDAGLTAVLTVTDSQDANIPAFMASGGELYVALGNRAPYVGETFKVLGSGDTADNGLQTSKGSAPVANDMFVVLGSTAVEYIGNIPT